MGFGIIGIAIGGTLFTYFLYSTIVIGYAISFYKNESKEFVKYFLKLWLPFLYMVVLLFSIEYIIDNFLLKFVYINNIFKTIFKVLLYITFCTPLKLIVESELNITLSFNSLKNILNPSTKKSI